VGVRAEVKAEVLESGGACFEAYNVSHFVAAPVNSQPCVVGNVLLSASCLRNGALYAASPADVIS